MILRNFQRRTRKKLDVFEFLKMNVNSSECFCKAWLCVNYLSKLFYFRHIQNSLSKFWKHVIDCANKIFYKDKILRKRSFRLREVSVDLTWTMNRLRLNIIFSLLAILYNFIEFYRNFQNIYQGVRNVSFRKIWRTY